MKKAHLHFIKFAIANGVDEFIIDYGDGETLNLGKATYSQVKDEVEAVDECFLIVKERGMTLGWVRVVMDVDEPEEYISDYSSNAFVSCWEREYYSE